MNRKEEFENLKMEYKNIEIPPEGKKEIQKVILRAKKDKRKVQYKKRIYKTMAAVAAMLIILVLPNTNETIAYSMKNIPVVGEFFNVITFREYSYKDNNSEMYIKTPKIENDNDVRVVEEVNKEVEEYTKRLIKQFKKDMKECGFNGLNATYKKITDTEKWFTLEITVTETKASGYEFRRYYHIDKENGKIVKLSDLFKEDCGYVNIISEEIKKQMIKQMENQEISYFIKGNEIFEGFSKIKNNQSFYFNKDGNLVIVFDEYEVAPGYMGMPEFVIPQNIVEPLYK